MDAEQRIVIPLQVVIFQWLAAQCARDALLRLAENAGSFGAELHRMRIQRN